MDTDICECGDKIGHIETCYFRQRQKLRNELAANIRAIRSLMVSWREATEARRRYSAKW